MKEPKKVKKYLKIWMNKNLLKTINLKNKLRVKCSKHPSNSRIKLQYKNLCRKLKKDISNCRDNYYQNKFSECEGNLKKEWNLINNIVNNSPRLDIKTSFLSDSSTITDSTEIANKFNDYFTSVAENSIPPDYSILCNCCKNLNLVIDAYSESIVSFLTILLH